MKIQKLSLAVMVSLFVGCGDASTSTTVAEAESIKTFRVAMDNSIHEASGNFNNYKVVVYTDGTVEDKPHNQAKLYTEKSMEKIQHHC